MLYIATQLQVTLERVKFARTMLCDEALPFVDLGRAGFQTQQHFTEVFHRYTGVTPPAIATCPPERR
jgi:AraC-like DNA-binding protein